MRTDDCWSCKDSRGVCNRGRPRCFKCAKSNKTCQYGLRLSWPKGANPKRSLIHPVVDKTGRVGPDSFVNTTSWDIQLYHYLRMSQGLGSNGTFTLKRLRVPQAISWLPVKLDPTETDLLDHFIYAAFTTLVVFEPGRNDVLGLVIRLALSNSLPSSMAVLQSILALSSLHKNGVQANAYQFKAKALRTLVASFTSGMDSSTIAQHIAASMVLCHLELLGTPNKVPLWYCHMNEAKTLIDNSGIDNGIFEGEYSGLLGWVEYHMVMGRFSIRHWYKRTATEIRAESSRSGDKYSCLLQEIKDITYCSHEVLRLVNFTFQIIRRPTDELYKSEEYEKTLRCLENRIMRMDTVVDSNPSWSATVELIKIATLIYLERASRNFSGPSSRIDAFVDKAHQLLGDMGSFQPVFPLLIIGCEARAEEQRKSLVSHMERVRKQGDSKALQQVQDIVQQIWVQDDLAVDYELDYLAKLDAVIGSYQMMPSFV